MIRGAARAAVALWMLVQPAAAQMEPGRTDAPMGAPAEAETGQQQAEAQATLTVASSDRYGRYLADAQGRALYLFTADTQGTGETATETACTSDACLDAWPPLRTEGDPQAASGVDATLTGTFTRPDGAMQVTYNGWPLYFFVKDTEPGQAAGQDVRGFGGEWYLVTPDGRKVEAEGEGGSR